MINKEEYENMIDHVLAYYTETKISRIFEMSVDMSDGDWDNEDAYGKIFDEYTKDLTRVFNHFVWEVRNGFLFRKQNR